MDSSLMESAIFAAIMALRDELKGKQNTVNSTQIQAFDSTPLHNALIAESTATFDPCQSVDNLERIAQRLFDGADKACGTNTSIVASELIPDLIDGILYEAIDSGQCTDEVKASVFDHATGYCKKGQHIEGNILFPPAGYDSSVSKQVGERLIELANGLFGLITTASIKANDFDGLFEFVSGVAVLMIYVEKSINSYFLGIDLADSPGSLVIEKALEAIDIKMAEMEEADPGIKEAVKAESNGSPSSSGGCYIATAVYGAYDCPPVWTLRRFRDYTLATSFWGRIFIRFYYLISPQLVRLFAEKEWFSRFWKKRLDKLVIKLNTDGVEDTPYNDIDWRG